MGLLFTLGPATAETKVYKIKSLENWALIDADGINAPATAEGDRDGVRCEYERGRDTRFRYTVPLKEFQRLEVEVKSERAMTLEISLTDETGARYRYEAPLEAKDWTNIAVTPADMALVEGSGAAERSLNPSTVVNALLLSESGFVLATPAEKKAETNTLAVRKVRVETPDKD